MKRQILLLLVAALVLTACEQKKEKKDEDDEPTSGNGKYDHHTVIVLDDGFDSAHEVFKDKIEAEYTLTCDKDDDVIDPEASFEDQKKAVILAYESTESPCSVEQDIKFEASADFATVLPDRDSWNEQILTKNITFDDDKIENLRKVIGGVSSNVNYHGTNTAGLIAYQNPEVKLVLIQYDLRDPNDGAVDDEDDCPKQAEIDAWVALHKDPDVLAAYKASPLDVANAKLLEIQVKHKTTLANLSLGSPPRLVLQQELEDAGCGKLDYLEYYQIEGKISSERERERIKAGVYAGTENTLTIQAAGNSGFEINGDDDANDCGDPEIGTVMVGAVDFEGKRTDFSNYGDCVQYYMMGKRVIVAAPEQFLDIADGTSFSAPLTVRLLSQRINPGATFTEMNEALADLAGTDQILGKDMFPNELAYDDTKDKIPAYALRGQPTPAVYSAHRYHQLTHPGVLK